MGGCVCGCGVVFCVFFVRDCLSDVCFVIGVFGFVFVFGIVLVFVVRSCFFLFFFCFYFYFLCVLGCGWMRTGFGSQSSFESGFPL